MRLVWGHTSLALSLHSLPSTKGALPPQWILVASTASGSQAGGNYSL